MENYIEILKVALIVIFGGFAIYAKTNQKLLELAVKAVEFINDAEVAFKDTTKAGGQKFEFVVNHLYALVPTILKSIITKEILAEITQRTFDKIEAYAKEQLDKNIK